MLQGNPGRFDWSFPVLLTLCRPKSGGWHVLWLFVGRLGTRRELDVVLRDGTRKRMRVPVAGQVKKRRLSPEEMESYLQEVKDASRKAK